MGKAENIVEKALIEEVNKHGGIAYKFKSPQRRNVPDRLCVLPDIPPFFVECKSKTGNLSRGQEREIERLVLLGQNAFVVASRMEAQAVISAVITHYRKVINK